MKNKKKINLLFKSNIFFVQDEIKVTRDDGKENPPFFCVSVPKKHFNRAVDRNKIRRRIKAALHNINLKADGNYLIVYKSLEIMPYQKIEKALFNIFNLAN